MKYVTLLAGCFILLVVSSIPSFAQQRTIPRVEGFDFQIAPPIKVTANTLKPGKKAVKNSSWLNQPVVQIENTSRNVIVYVVIEVNLPSGNFDGPIMLAYGQIPARKALSNAAVTLQPGAKASLSVNRNACDAVNSQLLARGVTPASGSRVNTRINGVVFSNGTAWFDGLLHVGDPHNPLRWNVVEKNPDYAELSKASPLFGFMQASYRMNSTLTPAPCWKRMGTEWVDCCGLQMASAIMFQVWGGLYEPHLMSMDCGIGYCEWIKQVGCTSDPTGGDPGAAAD